MKNDRRSFLKIVSLSAAATTIVPRGFGLTPHHPPAANSDGTVLIGLSAASFRPWIGSRFGLVDYSGAYLTLLSVDEKNSADAATGTPKLVGRTALHAKPTFTIGFSLHFHIVGMASQMKQNSYLLTHNGLGRFPLFLVPSGDRVPKTCTAQFSAAPMGIARPAPAPVRQRINQC